MEHREKEDGVICVARAGGEVLGFLAIDSFVAGRACGGLRIQQDANEPEIRLLARAMTLKYGFLSLPQGGAKAAVRFDPEAPRDQRRARLVAFAEALAPLLRRRIFAPCPDMATDASDIRHMLTCVGARPGRRELRENRSGYYTALSVMAGVRASAGHAGLELARCTAAVEGFGKVGRALAGLLAEAGVKVVAISTSRGGLYNPQGLDVAELDRLAERFGSDVVKGYPRAEAVATTQLPLLPVEVFCPCARSASLHAGNVAQAGAKVVCPGANNPLSPEAEAMLPARGVICVPDFVANCGGVLGGTMEFAGIGPEGIAATIGQRLVPAIAELLRRADDTHRPVREIAESLALSRFRRVQQQARQPRLAGRVVQAGLALHRRGLIPRRLVAALSRGYFDRRLSQRESDGQPP